MQCDILIIGAGPAGMAAALAAAPSGASIAIIDDNPAPGGQIWRDGPNAQVPVTARRMREQLVACTNVHIHSGARVISAPAPHTLLLEDAEHGWTIQWKTLILCTGARELLLPFPGWTLPGVTGAGGLQALIKSGLPVAGERIVVAGSGPLLLAAAASAHKAGAKVVRIAEQAGLGAVLGFAARLAASPRKALQALALIRPQYRTSSHVVAVRGQGRVGSVQMQQGGHVVEIACDRVACGFGLVPNTQLGQLLGCSLTPTGLAVDAWQATSQADIYAAGECTGVGGSERALVQGRIAGLAAVGDQADAQSLWPERSRWEAFAQQLARSFALAPQLKQLPQPDTLVCRCEDVPYASLQTCAGWTDAKLHARCGMGACQGRVCGTALQFLQGWEPPVPRNPLAPARIGTLAALYEKGE
ncbi:MAG: FAD/NAD(P)-binding oxidoreductase [Rhodoferax sp.]|uniref:FAD/NAD(P)-binding oxidoreductase n=1 Tax=Rhodoferax sp. TaxID=50421 RepID=UPI0032676871